MQEVSFTHETIHVAPLIAPTVSQDIFLIAHPRLEHSLSGPTVATPQAAPPLAKGVVLNGMVHRLLVAYVPQASNPITATGVGIVTYHAALMRLPTDEDLVPESVFSPSAGGLLFTNDAESGNPVTAVTPLKYRVLWREMGQIAVADGTITTNLTGVFDGTISSGGGFGSSGLAHLVRIPCRVRLGMDDGLFLVVECRTPFAGGDTIELGVDYWSIFGAKNMTRGNQYK